MDKESTHSLIELSHSTSVQYSLNELSTEWFEEIEQEEEENESYFEEVNYKEIISQLKTRVYSTGIYTFCYANYRQYNNKLINKYRSQKKHNKCISKS